MNLQPMLREGVRGGGSQVESLKPQGTKILIKKIPYLSFPNITSFLKMNKA